MGQKTHLAPNGLIHLLHDFIMTTTLDTLIIGAGFAGLGTAIQLKKAGIKNFAILERATEVGGTWRDNQYPGAACDIPSHLYSFSFAPNPDWSRNYSGSKEILSYVKHLVSYYGLGAYIEFGQTVQGLKFLEDEGVWEVRTQTQQWRAKSVVVASGPLSNPGYPNIAGLDTFKGHTIHSARWDHAYDFKGKRVAVIGTGASAVQIIPELVKEVALLKVFQRTAAWVLPRPDFKTPGWNKLLFRKLPTTQSLMRKALYAVHETMALGIIWDSMLTRLVERVSLLHLRHQVKDAWMRRQLKPDFKLGCKRVLVSNDYYPALQKPNAELISWPIATVCEKGIRTSEGIEHQIDCIVFATGFDVPKAGTPYPIEGLNGRQLADEWKGGSKAYKSINVSGYPNLFFTFGPNSGPGHNSALVYMESQIGYTVKAIQTILGKKLKLLDVKPEAQRKHNEQIQKRLAKTNWNSGCKSWYLTADGFNSTMYPGFALQYAAQMKTFKVNDYRRV